MAAVSNNIRRAGKEPPPDHAPREKLPHTFLGCHMGMNET